jgi:hypothetical protein
MKRFGVSDGENFTWNTVSFEAMMFVIQWERAIKEGGDAA